MPKLDKNVVAIMDAALENACRVLRHGGDHETREFVARKLKVNAAKGNTTFEGLSDVASRAVEELLKSKPLHHAEPEAKSRLS
ncbi:hypothetical protein [Bradyrhizobium jicamae]|uniref:hypothetical protein n=1 Tax=Bradyrhizobium jicamae TaxID=280332 RepID=UPI000A9AC695|nr:hypothetical protein [Bradyrhizobium jicamae]